MEESGNDLLLRLALYFKVCLIHRTQLNDLTSDPFLTEVSFFLKSQFVHTDDKKKLMSVLTELLLYVFMEKIMMVRTILFQWQTFQYIAKVYI